MDSEILSKIFSASAGVWAIFLAVTAAIFKAWPHIMGRSNERKRDIEAAEKADWDRRTEEIERLHARLANREKVLSDRDDENDRQRQENSELRQDRDEWKGRAVTAEATLLGLGNARQREAERLAKERETATQLASPNGNGK